MKKIVPSFIVIVMFTLVSCKPSDEQITESVQKVLTSNPSLSPVTATVNDGIVTLTGEVESDALKTLGNLLRAEAGTVGVLVNRQGDNVGVAVCAADDTGVHAGNLLKAILADFDGRGLYS